MKFWFWFLWAIDAVIAAVALYFFFSLAVGGRVGSFNISPWLAILAALAVLVGGSIWLRAAGQHAVASDPGSAVRVVLPPSADSPPEFSLRRKGSALGAASPIQLGPCRVVSS